MLRKMIKITGIFLAILLLTFSFTMNSQEISADPMKEKDKPHVKKMKVVDEWVADLSHPSDGIYNIYLKIKNPGKSNQTI